MLLHHYWRVFRRVGVSALSTVCRKVFQPLLESPRSRSSGWPASRYAMYRHLSGASARYNLNHDGLHLSISNSRVLINVLGFAGSVQDCAWPEYDLCSLDLPDEAFDSISSDQVLEHLHGSPFAALAESARVVRKGGAVIHTTVFSHHLHPKPFDHWRFSPQGLARLAESAGLEVLEVGGMDNALGRLLLKSRCLWQIKVSDHPVNPLGRLLTRNRGRLPTHVWLIARKP